VDRAAARKVIAAFPQTRKLALANRGFLVRAVQFLAEQGIRQFLDLGTGIPTSPNVHEVARQVAPGATVVDVDNDPVVTRHSQALRATHDLMIAVVHFIREEDDPAAVVDAFTRRMVPGSYFVLSHATSDEADPDVLSQIKDVYRDAAAPLVPRTAGQITSLFSGLELADPGRLVDVSQWHPGKRAMPTKIRILAGVGRKPGDPVERGGVRRTDDLPAANRQ